MACSNLVIYSLTLLSVLGLSSSIENMKNSKIVVCYFGSWASYRHGDGQYEVEDIDPMMCTHYIYGFAGLGEDNKIISLDPFNDLEECYGKGGYRRFSNLRLKNPNLKTLLAIGGWKEGSTKYSQMASSPQLRKIFIDSVIPFIQWQGFDGLDLDWEYPTQRGGVPEDRENFATLCAEMRVEFDKHDLLLTAAVSAGQFTIEQAYDIPSISQSLHFINIMTYDFRGAFPNHPYTGHHAAFQAMEIDLGDDALLNVQHAMKFWRDNGAPANKLILGMPTYGRGFTLQDPSNTGFYSPSNQGIPAGPYTGEPGYWGYNEMCDELNKGGWTIVHNEKVVGPYAFKKDWWIGYDDPNAIRVKSEWVNELGFGGAMFWSLETDDFKGKCGEKSALIKTAYRTLIGELEPEPTSPTDAPPKTTQQPPGSEECKKEGQFVGERCDSVFYVCVRSGNDWKLIPRNCKHPLYYDPSIKNCNWGDQMGCF